MKNSKMTEEQSTDFIEYLKQVINYEFLPKKLKNGLQDIIKDYEEITDNIESFALQDAYNIYAKENKTKQIEAPISYIQVLEFLNNNNLEKEDKEIFQSILNFCELNPEYKEHSCLDDKSSKDKIAILIYAHPDCADKVKELYSKYKGVFYSDSIEQAIDNYNIQQQSQELSGDINKLLNSEDNSS